MRILYDYGDIVKRNEIEYIRKGSAKLAPILPPTPLPPAYTPPIYSVMFEM